MRPTNPCLRNEETGLEIPPISGTVEPVIFVPPPRYLDSVVFRISAVSLTSHVFEDSFQVCFDILKCLGEKNDIVDMGAPAELLCHAQWM